MGNSQGHWWLDENRQLGRSVLGILQSHHQAGPTSVMDMEIGRMTWTGSYLWLQLTPSPDDSFQEFSPGVHQYRTSSRLRAIGRLADRIAPRECLSSSVSDQSLVTRLRSGCLQNPIRCRLISNTATRSVRCAIAQNAPAS